MATRKKAVKKPRVVIPIDVKLLQYSGKGFQPNYPNWAKKMLKKYPPHQLVITPDGGRLMYGVPHKGAWVGEPPHPLFDKEIVQHRAVEEHATVIEAQKLLRTYLPPRKEKRTAIKLGKRRVKKAKEDVRTTPKFYTLSLILKGRAVLQKHGLSAEKARTQADTWQRLYQPQHPTVMWS